MILTNIIGSIIKAKQRILTIMRYGKAIDAYECSPYGIDSNPINNIRAVYSSTVSSGSEVIIGYISKQQLAERGETRLYSTNEYGVIKYNVWLGNDGNLYLGHSVIKTDYTDNAVKYTPLNEGLQDQVTQINTQLDSIATAINSILPGTYVPVYINLNIESSKIETIKVE